MPFAEHVHDRVEVVARQIAIGPGPAAQCEQLVLVPFLAGHGGHDLLRQDVERRSGISIASKLPAAHRADQGQRFEQLVARQRKQPALGNLAQRVAGAADALQERGDRAGEPIWQTRSM